MIDKANKSLTKDYYKYEIVYLRVQGPQLGR